MTKKAATIVERDMRIDAIKGVAIILVVIGHVIQTYGNFESSLIIKYIYSYHMSLFMFVSGFLAFNKHIDLKKKFSTLVIPFIVWYQVSYLLQVFIFRNDIPYTEHMIRWIISPDWGLWFLWGLFLNFCYLKIVLYFTNHQVKYGDVVAILSAYLLSWYIPYNYGGIGYIKWYFIFFGIGYLSKKYSHEFRITIAVKIITVIAFGILGYMFNRMSLPIGWDNIMNIFIKYNLPLRTHMLNIYLVTTSFMGIASTFIILPNNKTLIQILAYYGRHSLDIYAIHQNIIIGFGSGLIRLLTSFMVSAHSSLAIAYTLKKSPILAKLLFGKR